MKKATAIAVFCFKRANKLRKCVEALLQNPECANMEILFFADGPRNAADEPGVNETRAFIMQLSGFKAVRPFFREKNLSTGPNFEQGLRYLGENYEDFIVVEDDLLVSPNYISYMLSALAFYRDSPSVFCVTGYCFPLRATDYPYDTIIYKRFCSYGWCGWSNKLKQVTWDPAKLEEMRRTVPGFRARLNREGRDLYRMLVKQLNGKISTWDIQLQVHISHHRMKVVYPTISKVDNIGFDADSTNTFGVNYLKTTIDPGIQRMFSFCPEAEIVPALESQIKKPYGLKALVTRKIMNTWIRMTAQVKAAS